MKFAGMNLKENRSGKKIGKTTLDKKGSSRLRKIFMDLAFKLVRKKEVYGSYFHAKMESGMSGNKAMVAVARKLVKAFYSVSMSGEEIDLKRIALCKSDFVKLAA